MTATGRRAMLTVPLTLRQQTIETEIDGVPVYTFAIAQTVIMTSLDNERIQIDTAARTWASDFRGQATGQGRCERVAP